MQERGRFPCGEFVLIRCEKQTAVYIHEHVCVCVHEHVNVPTLENTNLRWKSLFIRPHGQLDAGGMREYARLSKTGCLSMPDLKNSGASPIFYWRMSAWRLLSGSNTTLSGRTGSLMLVFSSLFPITPINPKYCGSPPMTAYKGNCIRKESETPD
jgi:hypothetical protein